jgi:hypothetical protein
MSMSKPSRSPLLLRDSKGGLPVIVPTLNVFVRCTVSRIFEVAPCEAAAPVEPWAVVDPPPDLVLLLEHPATATAIATTATVDSRRRRAKHVSRGALSIDPPNVDK